MCSYLACDAESMPYKGHDDRLGLQANPLCLLCNSHDEYHNHLFFECGYNFDLWSLVSSRCRVRPSDHGTKPPL
ncbi:hypothetical protein Bca4012_051952 [Brassica carinata]|uniref:Reverse transcriptase zinc-binding domain-containing protein n=1 Tax=Brassica carinata TaxID=52824 RepID=A0A8X7UMR1_BRACI|nr:hypothetical protein Bca52824_054496 [Brassica carinata]